MNNKIVVYIACFWIFTVLNSFFIWNSFGNIITALSAFSVMYSTFFIVNPKKLNIGLKNSKVFFAMFIYFIYLFIIKDDSIPSKLFRIIAYAPFFCIIFWPSTYFPKIYSLFRKCIIFFAIGSSVVTVLSAVGLIQYIPYIELDAQSALHERNNITYYVYGCFVTMHGSIETLIPRACGMLQEPGHFAVILGVIFMIDRFIGNKISIWIVICGFFTFSFNFILIALMGEFYNVFFNKKFKQTLKIYSLFIAVAILVFFSLNSDLRDQIYYLIYERNIENVIESFSDSGSVSGALDERINQSGAFYYKKFARSSDVWLGQKVNDESIILSDYRGMMLHIGILGLFLCCLSAVVVTNGAPWKIRFLLLCFMFLILMHRAWMLYPPYIFFFAYLAVVLYRERQNEHNLCKRLT